MKDCKQNAYLQHLLTGTGTETGIRTGTGSSCTLRRCCQTQKIETDSSEDDLKEPTPGRSQTKKRESPNKVIVIIFGTP